MTLDLLKGMRSLPGGEFLMGSDEYYPEERPKRRAWVAPFWIDEHPVTNEQFAAFVAATGHRTFAEIDPDPSLYPGLPPQLAKAGSLVFERPPGPVPLDRPDRWWKFRSGACWKRPLGEGSSIEGLEQHPVVHIAYSDAEAYVAWAGKQLPTEAEWEYAARGGLVDAEFAWGDEQTPQGAILANVWQGPFPVHNELLDGWERTSPIQSFPANGFGLFDMIGNVWEWTSDDSAPFANSSPTKRSCCSSESLKELVEHTGEQRSLASKVLKGGSHLCAPNYCQRYRPAARIAHSVDSTSSHIGFRCVVRR